MKEILVKFNSRIKEFKEEMGKIIVGNETIIEELICAMLAEGHVLVEGSPGLGKTLMVSTFAKILGLDFARIQFTPDMMPPDILGANIISSDERGNFSGFEFQKGPVFTNILLADEINRATPKTQSALLQLMQEKIVTIMGKTWEVPRPNFVFATQNPIEMEGTYPLPEAQIDRFLFKIITPFPDEKKLMTIFSKTTDSKTEEVQKIFGREEIIEYMALVKRVVMPSTVNEFVSKIVAYSHPDNTNAPDAVREFVRYGASPRAGIAMILGGKAMALLDERMNLSIDDIKKISKISLRHRLILNFEGEASLVNVDNIIEDIVKEAEKN